eukprot:CAMPEP_0182813006 /NCGR_PEP_ID=MMETSP0006_2-20121128/9110_1 /TAXON_ID=97485 /ORGANISM="Prymnesium parvum, Strain Texoma1" /LENGTH=184 /DNA_ID=CAMNT_0024939075 /DNA_START=236 /DNA_END=787 /DNA_ORIENTATION=+
MNSIAIGVEEVLLITCVQLAHRLHQHEGLIRLICNLHPVVPSEECALIGEGGQHHLLNEARAQLRQGRRALLRMRYPVSKALLRPKLCQARHESRTYARLDVPCAAAALFFASCREVHEHLREWVPRGQGGRGVALREKHRLRLVAGERPPNDAPSGEPRTIGAISEERLKPLLRRPILPHKQL